MPTRRTALKLFAATPVVAAAGTLGAGPAEADTIPAPRRSGGDVVVRDLTVPVPGLPGVPAYLVLPPPARPPAPAVLFLHWFDPAATDSDRTEFLAEATRLAARGVVSLLPQQAFPWAGDPVGDARDAATVRREVTRMAHAFHALLRRPEVDPRRVAVVGHDYGAMYAPLLAAREPRVAALAALAPDATWEHWFLAYWLGYEGDQATAYARLFTGLQPVDAVAAVARRRPVLLQFADDDQFIDAATRDRFRTAAPGATLGLHPGAGHHLDLAALTERTAWLTRALRLPG